MYKKFVSFLLMATLACFFQHCTNEADPVVDCAVSDLTLSVASSQAESGCGAQDGKIVVAATGGLSPYSFSLNGGTLQTSTEFTGLVAGAYTIKVVDKNACERTLNATLSSFTSTLAATASTSIDSECLTNNGSITVAASGGKSPYQFKLDAGNFGASNTFDQVKNGSHTILIKDAANCQISLAVQVERGNTGISYTSEIKAILDTNCNLSGCHAAGTGSRNWTDLTNLKNNATNIKIRTADKTMPPGAPLSQTNIDKIACWVDDGAPTNN